MEKVLKEITDILGKTKIDQYKLKRSDEINILDNIRLEKNPTYLYNSKIGKDEKILETQKEDKMNITGNQVQQRERNVQSYKRLPQYQEGAQIIVVNDKILEYKAGGYNTDEIYRGMLLYALSGLRKWTFF